MKYLVACEMFGVAKCNMACRYCYIPKTPVMQSIHERVVQAIRDGTWIGEVTKVSDQLEHLGIWGTEPTLVLDLVSSQMPKLIEACPNLTEFGFSTNLLQYPERIAGLAQVLDISDGRVTLDVQVSLDGPAWVTDVNRHPGATERIVQNMIWLAGEVARMGLKTPVKIHVKPTLTLDSMREMNVERIAEWFGFFDNLFDRCIAAAEGAENVWINADATPTFVVPGKYTVQDGRDAAAFWRRVCQVEAQRLPFKHVRGIYHQYVLRFLNMVRGSWELYRRPSSLTCSAGDTNAGYGLGKLHLCHRTFYMDIPEYVAEVDKQRDTWDVSDCGNTRIPIVNRFIVPVDDEMETARWQYAVRNYHDFHRFKFSYGVAMLKELAAAGQVSPVYAEPEPALLLAQFVNAAFSCPAENLMNTGSIHTAPVSVFRLLGNGLFEDILAYYADRTRIAA